MSALLANSVRPMYIFWWENLAVTAVEGLPTCRGLDSNFPRISTSHRLGPFESNLSGIDAELSQCTMR